MIMAEFVGRVGTPEGEIREETVSARSLAIARGELERRGFQVFKLARKGGTLPGFGGGVTKRVPRPVFIIFNTQLVLFDQGRACRCCNRWKS